MRALITTRRVLGALFTTLFLAVFLVACTDSGPSSSEKESESRAGSYDAQVAAQPAKRMEYSPTRETINFWIDTWDEPGKLSYVYLQSPDGSILGYYILKGLPVSMCAGLTPPYEVIRRGSESQMAVPAPGVDGVFYSGGQCNTYYGQDASGLYVEYTAGLGINVLLFDQPMPPQEVERRGGAHPLGFTSVEDVN